MKLGAMLFLVGLILLVVTITIVANINNSNNNNSELESIEKSPEIEKIISIERECEIIKLEKTLDYLEKAYDTFKTYINCDSIYLGIDRYSINLRLEGKNIHKYISMNISKSPFTQSELNHLRTLFFISDFSDFIRNPDERYTLNKGTVLYNLIIHRIDNYYENQIHAIKNKLQILN